MRSDVFERAAEDAHSATHAGAAAACLRPERFHAALWIAVAIGLLADAYLPLAQRGLLVDSPLSLLWPLGAAGGLIAILVLGGREAARGGWQTGAVVAVGLPFVAAVLMLDLLPPVARDELAHHLAIPALYLRAGRMLDIPFAIQAHYPMLLQMLYMPLLAHAAENLPKFMHLGFGLAAGALLFLYLVRRLARWQAALAALLFFTTPTVMVLAASAYVDLGLLFYATAGLLALLRWHETGRASYFCASALAAGCGAAAKYNGFLVVALLACGVMVIAQRRGTRAALMAAAGYGLLCLVPVAPWLLRNLTDTGNPVYPLLRHLFGGPPLPENRAIGLLTTRRLLYGESWLQIALLPVRVFTTGLEGVPSRFDGVFNPIYLLGFAPVFLPRTRGRDRALAGGAAALLLLVIGTTIMRSRYALPVLAPLAIVVAGAVARGLQAAGGRGRAVLAGLVACALMFNAAHLLRYWERMDPLPYLTGRRSRAEQIARFVPEYPVTVYANAHLSSGVLIYLSFLGSRGYYWQRPYIYDVSYTSVTLSSAVRESRSAAGVRAALRGRGITHIAAADHLLARFMNDNLTSREHRRWQAFKAQFLELLYRRGNDSLYAIRPGEALAPPTAEPYMNPPSDGRPGQ